MLYFGFPSGFTRSWIASRFQSSAIRSSCTDCHTPGTFFGRPDKTRFLAGSDVGFGIPGLGVFVPPNLTPDVATGLGKWSAKEIATALTTGVRPDGRILAPIMPWPSFAHLTVEVGLAPGRAGLRSPTPGLGACLSQRFTPPVPSTSGDRGLAIALSLKSLAPVVRQVPGPFRPGQTPTVPVMAVIPGSLYATLPPTPAPNSR